MPGESSLSVSIGILAPLERHTGNHQFSISLKDINRNILSSSVVTIVNNFAIIFSNRSFEANVPEGQLAGAKIVPIPLWDRSFSNVSFSMNSGNDMFSINSTTGEIFTKVVLNWLVMPFYNVVIKASLPDASFDFASVRINVLDLNDNTPTFTQTLYFASFNESAPVGTFVAQVVATDRDFGRNGSVVYFLSSPSSDFTLDNSTGIIYTNRLFRAVVDPTTFSLSIRAADQGPVPKTSSLVSVSIFLQDLNLNSPVFGQPFFNISVLESTSPGSVLLSLTATDADRVGSRNSLISFFQVGNDRYFSVSPTGVVTLQLPLDFMVQNLYNLSIAVTDSGSPARVTTSFIIFNILLVQYPPPQFSSSMFSRVFTNNLDSGVQIVSLSLLEGSTIPAHIPVVFAFENSSLLQTFDINTSTGIISSKKVLLRFHFLSPTEPLSPAFCLLTFSSSMRIFTPHSPSSSQRFEVCVLIFCQLHL